MLSLSSLLNTEPTAPVQHPMDDRGEHYSYPPPWKGSGGGGKGKKGSQTALSALTLLAFLFFLNMLQNREYSPYCKQIFGNKERQKTSALQEQMSNNAPIVVMMTTSTTTVTTVEGQRQKRDDERAFNSKGDTGSIKNSKLKTGCPAQECDASTEQTAIDSPFDPP